MTTETTAWLTRVGRYTGHGIDHDDQPFFGELAIEALPGDQGVALSYRASGLTGTVLHDERAWLAPDPTGRLALWSIHTNGRGVTTLTRRHGAPAAGADATWVFGAGEPGDLDAMRVEVALDLWPDGSVSWRYAWGMPGQDLAPRSAARMTLEPA